MVYRVPCAKTSIFIVRVASLKRTCFVSFCDTWQKVTNTKGGHFLMFYWILLTNANRKKNYYLHICTRGKLHIGHLFLEGINCLVLTLTKHTIFTISFTIVSPRNVIWTSSVDDCLSQSALRLSPRGSPSIQYWLKLSSKLPEVRDNIWDTVGVVKTRNDEMVLNNVGYGYPYNYRELTTF